MAGHVEMTDQREAAFAKTAIGLLDLTDLDAGLSPKRIEDLCTRAMTPAGPVAAICIWPDSVRQAKAELAATPVSVATVVNFPSGDLPLHDVLAQTAAAIDRGADEIDAVIPYKALLAGDGQPARELLRELRSVCDKEIALKAILETGMLQQPEPIRLAARIAIDAGADFIKTSTGKVPVGASPEAAQIMLDEISLAGGETGLKLSGGIRTVKDARLYFDLAAARMGDGWPCRKRFRFGASGLLDALLEEAGLQQPVPARPRSGEIY